MPTCIYIVTTTSITRSPWSTESLSTNTMIGRHHVLLCVPFVGFEFCQYSFVCLYLFMWVCVPHKQMFPLPWLEWMLFLFLPKVSEFARAAATYGRWSFCSDNTGDEGRLLSSVRLHPVCWGLNIWLAYIHVQTYGTKCPFTQHVYEGRFSKCLWVSV